ncbi:MAG TPA: DUF2092 domain-containing protein [Pirellulales bacterium]|jgi:peroxiredoxin
MRSSLRLNAIIAVAALLAVATAAPCRAANDKPGASAAIEPQARQVLEHMGTYLAGLKSFSVTTDIKLEVSQGADTKSFVIVQKLQAERPNKLTFILKSDASNGELVCDGVNLSIFIQGLGKYLEEKSPETWEKIFQNPLAAAVISPGNAKLVTLSLLSHESATLLLSTAESAKYGGEVMLDGVKCHLIEVMSNEVDWKLWVDVGDKPLPRQFVPDLTKTFAKMAAGARGGNAALANVKVTDTVTYKDWVENPKFGEDAFVFNVPAGAVKAESLADMIGGRESGPHPLLAKAAPAIKLDLLGGGTLDLAALKGKNVVILDFWATWCGPCQKAMPIIEKVAREYKDKGVLLYAVNIQETPEEVKSFVDESGLHVPIALDKEGTVARAYLANSIPQTVIVGKDGIVQVVHVGLSPALEDELKNELDALVAGKDLAAGDNPRNSPTAAAAADKAKE